MILKPLKAKPTKAIIAARKRALFKALKDPKVARKFLTEARVLDKKGSFILPER